MDGGLDQCGSVKVVESNQILDIILEVELT